MIVTVLVLGPCIKRGGRSPLSRTEIHILWTPAGSNLAPHIVGFFFFFFFFFMLHQLPLDGRCPSPTLHLINVRLLLPFLHSELPAQATQTAGTLSGQPPTRPNWLQPTNGSPPQAIAQQDNMVPPAGNQSPTPLHPFCNPSLPPIPPRILKSIQTGSYTDLTELLPEALADAFDRPPPKDGKDDQAPKKRFVISNALDWGLAFATFAAACSHYHPEMAPKLIAYTGIILRLAREVEGLTWLRYDKAFRQAAAINPALRWDQRQPDIWLASLTGHSSSMGLTPAAPLKEQLPAPPPLKRAPSATESCFRWNRGECSSRTCKYMHDCLICHGTTHTARDCPILRPSGWRFPPRSIPPRTGGDSRKPT